MLYFCSSLRCVCVSLRLRVHCVDVDVNGWVARQMHARAFGKHTRLRAHTAFKANCEMKNPQNETGDR
jgi:hypothetical protein